MPVTMQEVQGPMPPSLALSVAGRPVASGDGAGGTGGGEAAGASETGEAARGSRSRCRDDVVINMTSALTMSRFYAE